jgi:predicted ribosome quality control (RQC) complex YloA/Tae2 family protein
MSKIADLFSTFLKSNKMKKITSISLFSIMTLMIFSCGSGKNKSTVIESKDGEVTVNNIQKAGEQMKDAMEEAEKRRKERRERGDTLAMNYKDLQKYLPEVNGYTKTGTPGGESMNMPGFGSFSKADQNYENGEKRIEIELMDYNQSALGFTAATGMFGLNIQMENDQEKSGSFETGMSAVKGYERISKKEDEADVTYAIADRFILTIKSRGSNDVELLKNIAKKMNLSELASK